MPAVAGWGPQQQSKSHWGALSEELPGCLTGAQPILPFQLFSQAKPRGSDRRSCWTVPVFHLNWEGSRCFCVFSALIPLQKVPAEETVAFSILFLGNLVAFFVERTRTVLPDGSPYFCLPCIIWWHKPHLLLCTESLQWHQLVLPPSFINATKTPPCTNYLVPLAKASKMLQGWSHPGSLWALSSPDFGGHLLDVFWLSKPSTCVRPCWSLVFTHPTLLWERDHSPSHLVKLPV